MGRGKPGLFENRSFFVKMKPIVRNSQALFDCAGAVVLAVAGIPGQDLPIDFQAASGIDTVAVIFLPGLERAFVLFPVNQVRG